MNTYYETVIAIIRSQYSYNSSYTEWVTYSTLRYINYKPLLNDFIYVIVPSKLTALSLQFIYFIVLYLQYDTIKMIVECSLSAIPTTTTPH